jgi:hypothetical protein
MKLGLYQHYKGAYYQVIGIARHEESLEPLVVYQALYGDYALWVRRKEVFESFVEKDGEKISRFKFIRENLTEMPELR